jgi:hypothetical protein
MKTKLRSHLSDIDEKRRWTARILSTLSVIWVDQGWCRTAAVRGKWAIARCDKATRENFYLVDVGREHGKESVTLELGREVFHTKNVDEAMYRFALLALAVHAAKAKRT